ncbi:hypothetical protein [Bizionia argentinensis]|nr:hypothetical protein [Bizionia argentinensis]
MKKTGLTIRIEDYLREEIERRAEENNQTVSAYVRQVLMDKHFIFA